jgi:hypothetical protein
MAGFTRWTGRRALTPGAKGEKRDTLHHGAAVQKPDELYRRLIAAGWADITITTSNGEEWKP